MAPRFAERRGYAPSDSPANARSAPGNPWRSSVTVRGGSLMLVAVGHAKILPVEDADHAAAM